MPSCYRNTNREGGGSAFYEVFPSNHKSSKDTCRHWFKFVQAKQILGLANFNDRMNIRKAKNFKKGFIGSFFPIVWLSWQWQSGSEPQLPLRLNPITVRYRSCYNISKTDYQRNFRGTFPFKLESPLPI